MFKRIKILLLFMVALFATRSVMAQTDNTNPQIVCLGYIGAYQVDYLENTGSGTLGSSYAWSIITPGFVGTITTNQGPGSSENRIIIDWGATPVGFYDIQIIESSSGCSGIPILLNVQVVPVSLGTDVQNACNTFTWIDGIT